MSHLTGLAKWMETEQSLLKYVNVYFLYGYHMFHVRLCLDNILLHFMPEQQWTRTYFIWFCLLSDVWYGVTEALLPV